MRENDSGQATLRGLVSFACTQVFSFHKPLIGAALNSMVGGHSMNGKALFTGTVLLAGLFCPALPAFAQSSPPTSETVKQTEALVDKAATLIDSKGKDAFSEFRIKGSEWFHGDTYLFIYDQKGNVLLNPAFPTREGTNISGQKDTNGKPFQDALILTAATKGSGWVDYMFLRPGQTQPSHKWTYVRAVKINGVPGLVGSGFYSE
jgi:cytochrome c